MKAADLCRVPTSLRPIFGPSADLDRDALYSEAQVQQALQCYAEQQQPPAPSGCIRLDRYTAPANRHGRGWRSPFFRARFPGSRFNMKGALEKHTMNVPGF